MQGWPVESRDAAQRVIKKYGEPDEACHSSLLWGNRGSWKRIVAYRETSKHNFPAPHVEAIECYIEFHIPPWKVSDLVRFDGSVVVYRTLGEISVRGHDEETNFLSLNLAYDIITGKLSVDDARRYYAQEFLNHMRKAPTPYMKGLKFEPKRSDDPDERVISDAELKRALDEGKRKASAA
jgi:hypothetical protein